MIVTIIPDFITDRSQSPTAWSPPPAASLPAPMVGRPTWRGSWSLRPWGITPPWATWQPRSTLRSTPCTRSLRPWGWRQRLTRTTRLLRTWSSSCSRPPCYLQDSHWTTQRHTLTASTEWSSLVLVSFFFYSSYCAIIRVFVFANEWISLSGIDDDESAVEDLIQPADEDMPVLEGDEDTSRMEEVD